MSDVKDFTLPAGVGINRSTAPKISRPGLGALTVGIMIATAGLLYELYRLGVLFASEGWIVDAKIGMSYGAIGIIVSSVCAVVFGVCYVGKEPIWQRITAFVVTSIWANALILFLAAMLSAPIIDLSLH